LSKNLDTSWFDLKNYEALHSFSIEDWACVIEARVFYIEEYEKRGAEPFYDWHYLEEIKQNPIINSAGNSYADDWFRVSINEEVHGRDYMSNSFSTLSVDSLKNYQAWKMVSDPPHTNRKFWELRDEWNKLWEEDTENQEYLLEAGHAPYDFHYKHYLNLDYMPSEAHVVIDMNAPDEQIEKDFSHWLKNYRKVADYRVPEKKIHEKLFTQKTFDFWIRYGLIPYLDLVLVAKVEGKEITQEKLGELIFPDDPIDSLAYRIRTITIPEAEQLTKYSVHRSLIQQAANEVVMARKNL
jgi:Family of unknown function (DUF6387)